MRAPSSLRWPDAALPAGLAVVCVLELGASRPQGWAAGAAVELLACALLVPRRRWPLATPVLAVALVFSIPYLGGQLDDASAPIGIVALATYTLGRHLPLRRGLLGLVGMAVAMALVYLVADERLEGPGDVIFFAALFLPPFVLGRVVRRVSAQSEQLVRQQEWIEREAARGERLRIARELHDVLAHSLSAMVVQTAAARDLVRTDPAAAEAGLDAVAEAGRAALAETGRMLHVLRDDDDEMALGPAPTLARLGELVAAAGCRGLHVRLTVIPDAGALAALPATIDVSAFRIVQESLTNAARHATGDTVDLSLVLGEDELVIEVGNDCAPTPAAPRPGRATSPGSGLGVTGMAERAELFGGRLDRTLRAGRHVLTVHLPVPVDRPVTPAATATGAAG